MSLDSAVTLRLCVPGDEQALALVGGATFLDAFAGTLDGADLLAHCRFHHTEAKYAAWLTRSEASLCLAEVGGSPIGYALLSPPDLPVPIAETDIELKRIYLMHRFHNLGVGKALMNWAIEKARSLGKTRLLLGVYGENDKAIAFYLRNGFKKIGTRQFLVGVTLHDDLVLGLDL